ncbi:MAG TPA: FxSxx-COOH system tetratricopeptide repeat protein [Streptosporangiaceae bacterium]
MAIDERPGPGARVKRSIAGETLSGISQSGDHARASQHVHMVSLPRPAGVDAPPGLNTLPRRPTDVFVGREEALRQLHEALGPESSKVAVTQALHGLGGVGKTELALHYADASRDRYGLIGWITADSPENVDAGLAALAARIHPEVANATTTVATEWALAWLQSHSGWLLVLDNVEDRKHVERLIGQLASGHILVTSRRDTWRGLATPIKLEVLIPEAAIDLVVRITGAVEREVAGEIAAELGYLPLALEQAGAYIRETGITLGRYLELLRERPARMYATASESSDAQRTVARVWDITLTAIAARNSTAVQLLNVLAWYAPEGIPRELVASNDDQADIDEALGLLASYSMIDRVGEIVSVHRLIQAVLINKQGAFKSPAHDRLNFQLIAISWLVEYSPDDPQSDVQGWPRWRSLIPHIDALAKVADVSMLGPLFNSASIYLLTQGAYLHAMEYSERALRAYEATLGPGHPGVATALGNLASAHIELGHMEDALKLQMRALAIALGRAERDDLVIAPLLASIARLFKETGRTPEALPLEEQALKMAEVALGPMHPQVAIAMANLATTYRILGRASDAERLFQRALRILEAVRGPDHPDVATALGGLAVTYKVLGRSEEALPLEKRALRIAESALGAEHPRVARRLANLAYTYDILGRPVDALPLLVRASAIMDTALGHDHPGAAVLFGNLALTYSRLGRQADAHVAARRAYACARARFGESHSITEWVKKLCDELGVNV